MILATIEAMLFVLSCNNMNASKYTCGLTKHDRIANGKQLHLSHDQGAAWKDFVHKQITYYQYGYVITSMVKINSKNPTVLLNLEHVLSSYTLLGLWLFIQVGIHVNLR